MKNINFLILLALFIVFLINVFIWLFGNKMPKANIDNVGYDVGNSIVYELTESVKYNNKPISYADILFDNVGANVDSCILRRKICLFIPSNVCGSCVLKTLEYFHKPPINRLKDNVIVISSFDVRHKYNIKKRQNDIMYLQSNLDVFGLKITDADENVFLFFVEDELIISSYILTPMILSYADVIMTAAYSFLINEDLIM